MLAQNTLSAYSTHRRDNNKVEDIVSATLYLRWEFHQLDVLISPVVIGYQICAVI